VLTELRLPVPHTYAQTKDKFTGCIKLQYRSSYIAGGKADVSPPSVVEVKSGRTCTSSPLLDFHGTPDDNLKLLRYIEKRHFIPNTQFQQVVTPKRTHLYVNVLYKAYKVWHHSSFGIAGSHTARCMDVDKYMTLRVADPPFKLF
jgi:hypothetical protein